MVVLVRQGRTPFPGKALVGVGVVNDIATVVGLQGGKAPFPTPFSRPPADGRVVVAPMARDGPAVCPVAVDGTVARLVPAETVVLAGGLVDTVVGPHVVAVGLVGRAVRPGVPVPVRTRLGPTKIVVADVARPTLTPLVDDAAVTPSGLAVEAVAVAHGPVGPVEIKTGEVGRANTVEAKGAHGVHVPPGRIAT